MQGLKARSAARASLRVLYGVPPATSTTVFPLGFFGRTEHLRVFCVLNDVIFACEGRGGRSDRNEAGEEDSCSHGILSPPCNKPKVSGKRAQADASTLMMRVRMGSSPRMVELGSTQARNRGLAQVAGPAPVLRGGRDIGAHEMNVRPVREAVARLCRSEPDGR